MTTNVIGGARRESFCAECLLKSSLDTRFSHAVILPVPTTRDGVYINGTDEALSSLVSLSRRGVIFCAHSLPHAISEKIEERGGAVADISEDERFVLENAILTAECALSYIMNESERALSELSVGIVGYGRIGKELVKLLLFHGAQVKVFTTRDSVRVMLCELGVAAELVSESKLDGIDILVNTAPARLFSEKQLKNSNLKILELASGNNFKNSENLTRLPSLPGKMLPESSGRLYAEAVLREIERQGDVK